MTWIGAAASRRAPPPLPALAPLLPWSPKGGRKERFRDTARTGAAAAMASASTAKGGRGVARAERKHPFHNRAARRRGQCDGPHYCRTMGVGSP